jgi:hypothetical protein
MKKLLLVAAVSLLPFMAMADTPSTATASPVNDIKMEAVTDWLGSHPSEKQFCDEVSTEVWNKVTGNKPRDNKFWDAHKMSVQKVVYMLRDEEDWQKANPATRKRVVEEASSRILGRILRAYMDLPGEGADSKIIGGEK